MTERTTPTELDALRARVAALEAAQATTPRRRAAPRARWLGVALVALLALLPATLGASDRFGDVPTDAFYHEDASALADIGVIQGCGDGSVYCPGDFATRGELASFLARLGGLGGHPPVVNAATLGGVSLADLETTPGPPGPVGPLVAAGGAPLPSPVPLVAGVEVLVREVTLVAPSAGQVLLAGTVGFSYGGGRIILRNATTGDSAVGPLVSVDSYQPTASYTFALPVDAGANTLRLLVVRESGGPSIVQADLVALFVAAP